MAEPLKWRPYTNPEDGRNGWISPQGKVVYGENPQRQEEQGQGDSPAPQAAPNKQALQSQLTDLKADPSKVTAQSFKQLVDGLSAISSKELAELGQQFSSDVVDQSQTQPEEQDTAIANKPDSIPEAEQSEHAKGVTSFEPDERTIEAIKSYQQHSKDYAENKAKNSSTANRDAQHHGMLMQTTKAWLDRNSPGWEEYARDNQEALKPKERTPEQISAGHEQAQATGKAKADDQKAKTQAFLKKQAELKARVAAKAKNSPAAASGQPKPATEPAKRQEAQKTATGDKPGLIKQTDAQGKAEAPMRLVKDFPGRVDAVQGEPNAMHVRTRYGEPLAKFLSSMGAIWNRDAKRWRIPKDQSYQVYNFLLNPPGDEPVKFSRGGRPVWTFTIEVI